MSLDADGHHGVAISYFDKLEGFPALLPQAFMFIGFGGNLVEMESLQPGGKMFNDVSGRLRASLFATLMTFLRQRILVSPRFLADRATRRRLERASRGPRTNEVRVVTLRSIERRGKGGHRDVEWGCRWIVRGHWRNQWYPSAKHHQPKWIAPYMKGPEDKPLRHSERLFAVVR